MTKNTTQDTPFTKDFEEAIPYDYEVEYTQLFSDLLSRTHLNSILSLLENKSALPPLIILDSSQDMFNIHQCMIKNNYFILNYLQVDTIHYKNYNDLINNVFATFYSGDTGVLSLPRFGRELFVCLSSTSFFFKNRREEMHSN